MKSGKQRRTELTQRRAERAAEVRAAAEARAKLPPYGAAMVNAAALAPNVSYSEPDFVRRGFYVDVPFRCVDCGKDEVWTAGQQKWWYEVAKGQLFTTAVRCRSCRRRARERSAESRRVHLEGVARKAER